MASFEFYDQNRFRDYPLVGPKSPAGAAPVLNSSNAGGFVVPADNQIGPPTPNQSPTNSISSQAARVPRDLLVDAFFTLGPGMDFRPGTDEVKLSRVTKEPGGIKLTFLIAVSGSIKTVSFSVPLGVEMHTVYAETNEEGCDGRWLDGSLVIGSTDSTRDALVALNDNDFVVLVGSVEPSLVLPMRGLAVTSVSLANQQRTLYRSVCDEDNDDDRDEYKIVERCIRGPLVAVPGYNSIISQNVIDNSITFSAGVGAGAGRQCGEVERYPGERRNNKLLDGSPKCDDTVRSVNGIGGPIVAMRGDGGVRVFVEPSTPNTVTIDTTNVGRSQDE